MGGALSRAKRVDAVGLIAKGGGSKGGGKEKAFHLDRLPLSRILGFLDDTDVWVLRCCNRKVVFGWR